ncbi:uncharacterized protein VTP21DRAFT_7451 [Calcarisporiella thermophila]|uniref:uncharacterized protein n=1 Tax=Calcarisporiella thermophila TaxID=911321 RepID=UPI00374490E9
MKASVLFALASYALIALSEVAPAQGKLSKASAPKVTSTPLLRLGQLLTVDGSSKPLIRINAQRAGSNWYNRYPNNNAQPVIQVGDLIDSLGKLLNSL